jgi:hypothetical protein
MKKEKKSFQRKRRPTSISYIPLVQYKNEFVHKIRTIHENAAVTLQNIAKIGGLLIPKATTIILIKQIYLDGYLKSYSSI